MRFSGVSANAVWNNAIRSLTGLGSGTIAAVSSIHTSIANGVLVDLRPASGKFRECTVLGETTVNVTWASCLYDGVTFRVGPLGSSGAGMFQVMNGSFTFGPAFQNAGTVSGFYNLSGFDLSQ